MAEVRKLQIASRMEGITEVEGLINELCEEFGVEETHYGEILIAMTEAVNNAVVHGNKLDARKMVDIEVRTEGPILEFRVADQGPGFDFDNIVGEEEVQFTDVMTQPTGAILNPGAHSAALSEPKRRIEELKGDGARGVH